MIRLVGRRILILVPVVLIVSFGVFMLLALIPGDPAVTLAGGINATPAQVAKVRAQLHLNDPLLVQYWDWLRGVLHVNLGTSLISGTPVWPQITSRLPVTLSLVLAAAVVALVIGVPLGIYSGLRAGRASAAIARMLSSLGVALPNFWIAVIVVSVFSVHWHIFPPTGYTALSTSFVGWLKSIALPAVALGVTVAATIARQLRAALIEVLGSPYVRTAWAKGCSARQVILSHALKNAALPAVTVLGLQIGALLGGSVVIEQIFSIPGIGTYLFTGISNHDLPVVQGVALTFVVVQVLVSLAVDVCYLYLNPKVRVA